MRQRRAWPFGRRPAAASRSRDAFGPACARPTCSPASAATNSSCCRTDVEKPEQAAALARRLVEAMAEPFDLDGRQVYLGVSIGISVCPDDGADVDVSAEECRHGDVSLQIRRAQHLSLLRIRDGRTHAGAPPARAGPAARESPTTNSSSTTSRRSIAHDRGDHRLRGAAALAPSDARHGLAGRFHSARRGNRRHRAARRLGHPAGLPRRGDLAAPYRRRGQPVVGAVQGPRARRRR